MPRTIRSSTLAFISLGILVLSVFFFLLGTQLATALFLGPGSDPTGAQGALGLDSAQNISVGTSTAAANTKFLVIPAGTNTYGLRVMRSNGSSPVLIVTETGRVGVATGTAAALPAELTVQGNLIVSGNITAASITGGTSGGTVSAADVTADEFGRLQGGGTYYFPSVLGVGATTSLPGSAILVASSSNKAFLPPRMTTTQRNAIPSPVAGLVIYNTSANELGLNYYDGTQWVVVNSYGP